MSKRYIRVCWQNASEPYEVHRGVDGKLEIHIPCDMPVFDGTGEYVEYLEEEATVVTTAEAAEILGVSESRVKYRLKTGTLPGEKIGSIWQIPREAVEKEAAEKASQSEPQND